MKLESLTTRSEVGDWLNAAGLTGEGIEIGVLRGENAEAILSKWSGILHLVDPWQTQPDAEYCDCTNTVSFPSVLAEARQRMKRFHGRAFFHIMFSDDAFDLFSDIGAQFVFAHLDGNHNREQFTRDIEQWWSLIKSGGLFSGHDYLDVDLPHWKCAVKSVVDAFVARNGLSLHLTNEENGPQSWWIIKP